MKLSAKAFQSLIGSKQTEQDIQISCVKWFRHKYPNYLLYANYNNVKDKTTGGINKGMGVFPGVADLTLLFSGEIHFIEMKTPKGTQSQAQKLFQERATDQGAHYHICRSLPEFQSLISSILNVTF